MIVKAYNSHMGKFVDRTGFVYGRLTVLSATMRRNVSGSVYWLCKCSCGNEVEVSSSCLQTKQTTSCGCYFIEVASAKGKAKKTHGMTKTKIYKTWSGMIQRCTNPKNNKFANYGKRGIVVCDAWKSFDAFFKDMGLPKNGESLDRIDTNGNYEPSNCRWATQLVQQNNRRDNVEICLNGEKMTLAQYARKHNLNQDKIQQRLKRGWSVQKACQP